MLIIVGVSASGKSTLATYLIESGNLGAASFKLSKSKLVTCTTRPKRPGEVDGVDYHFMTNEEFLEADEQGLFLEVAEYHVANGETWRYGSKITDFSQQTIAVLTPAGMRAAIKEFGDKFPVATVYLNVPRRDAFIKCLQRGDNIDEAYRRNVSDEGMFAGIEADVDVILRNDGYQKNVETLSKELSEKIDLIENLGF